MDMLLKNQSIALSALVNTTATGNLDFEMSPAFISQYSVQNPKAFFRFFDYRDNKLLKESVDAFPVGCNTYSEKSDVVIDGILFRLRSVIFSPDPDSGVERSRSTSPRRVCLVMGIDQAPYQSLVVQTLFSSIPVLVFIVILLIVALVFLVRNLTSDLSALTAALATADFGAKHEFPVLPAANTPEVKAVVANLVKLHVQAAEVYREMWLFLGRASHQLKTPVAAIQATLEVLIRRERSKEELLLGLADIKLATTQLNHLTKNLISSSRISYEESSQRRELMDLVGFISTQVRTFKAQADQLGISIVMGANSPIMVRANALLLSEIFGNLIENSILYSTNKKPSSITIACNIENRNVVVLISDQGPGFPMSVLQSLFQPFIRGDESRISGSGLGLSIAKKSAQLLLGDILIQETNSTGSKVAVILPIQMSIHNE